LRFKRDRLNIPAVRNAEAIILSHQRRHADVEHIVQHEMEKRFKTSPHNEIGHYAIEMDNYQSGTSKTTRMFRSLCNPKDYAMLKGKEFFNKELLNPY
jgi:hypothetical protein